jgi:flavin-dependent dehydrogenase
MAVSQDKIEPVLRETALEKGADLRLGHRVTSWSQNNDGVTVTAVDANGVESTIQGQYLVACDGAHSPVREALGITRSGVGHLKVLRSILFFCPHLDKYFESGIGQFQIEGREDGFEGFMMTYGGGRWALMWNPPDKVEATKDEMDAATQKDMIRKAAGEHIPDEDIELITTGEWQLSGLVADTFSSGRVFIAGDAAHALPPNRGGYGANTGIADGHNLAWKLAAVLNGTSRPDLLSTYDAERRSAAKVRHDQIFVRDDYTRHIKEREWADKGTAILDDVAMELGQVYRSEGVVGGDEDVPAAKRPDEWNGQPGTRAPHVLLRRRGEVISSLDLFCHGWVLVSKNDAWRKPTSEASEATGVDVTFVHVGEDADVQETDDGSIGKSFGIGETGAILVRPDGYVAWRSSSNGDDEMKALGSVLGQVSFAVKGN